VAADTLTFDHAALALIGLIVLLGVIAGLRVASRDRTVRAWRFGFFYERDVDDDPPREERDS
jgi:hypothetical protein